jgi:WD40 repeat protein
MFSVAFSPDGHRLVTTALDGAQVWDVGSGRQLVETPWHAGKVLGAAFSPDGQRIVTASDDKTARLWDAGTGAEIGVPFTGHEAGVNGVAFSPDGRTIATASDDRTVRIWDVETHALVRVLKGHTGRVQHVAFSADGQRIVSTEEDAVRREDAVRIWEARTGETIAVLGGRGDAVFSPDGQRVATGATNDNARIWDIKTARTIAIFHGDWAVDGVDFSPDGRRLLTTSRVQRSVHRWRVVPTSQELIDAAKRTIPRCLTREQREQAFLDPAPPAWCIEMKKWPYQSQDWADWLKSKRAGLDPRLPDAAASKD